MVEEYIVALNAIKKPMLKEQEGEYMNCRALHESVIEAFAQYVAKHDAGKRELNPGSLIAGTISDLLLFDKQGVYAYEVKCPYDDIKKGIGQCAITSACQIQSWLIFHEYDWPKRIGVLGLFAWLGVITYDFSNPNGDYNFTVKKEPSQTAQFPDIPEDLRAWCYRATMLDMLKKLPPKIGKRKIVVPKTKRRESSRFLSLRLR